MSLENIEASTSNLATSKDIWSLVKDQKDKKFDEPIESSLLIAGASGCGKSTIITKFLDKNESPSPSVALEYTFGRRTRAQGSIKDITHIYELAGATRLSDLLNVPISESNIHNVTIILCVDLSKPHEMLDILDHFIFSITAKIGAILDRLEAKGSKRPKALRAHMLKRFGVDHPDMDTVKLFPVPLLIIGTKYDSLKPMESELRKSICKTLRFVAHSNGASLLFHSSMEEQLNVKARQFISHFTFRTTPPKPLVTDHMKPVLILAGQDFYAQIGVPSAENAEVLGKKTIPTYEAWRSAFIKYFPPQETIDTNLFVNLALYPESTIDSLRERKNLELEKIRANNERREKDLAATLKDVKKTGKSYSRSRFEPEISFYRAIQIGISV